MKFYYTFRLSSLEPMLFECVKWEETGDGPVDKYTINPSIGKCSCPAVSRECKHVRCVEEIVKENMMYDMYKFKWDEDAEWTELYDIVPIEDLL